MRRNEKEGQKVIERIEMDATILNVLTYTKDGRPIKRPQLFMATNVWDRRIRFGFTMAEAIEKLLRTYDEDN